MSLRIDQFNTTCHVPPQRRSDAEIVDRLARGCFAHDLSEHLGPSLARQHAIIRIRRLPMRVIVPASEWNEDALSLRWRQEFGKALFTALAYPADTGPLEVFRADSIAGFVASAIRDLLDGTAPNKWQYAEFESFFRLGSTQAALALICEWPQQSLAVLLHLSVQNALSRLLTRFDDGAMEHVISTLVPSTETEIKTLSLADLITVAKLALEHLPDRALVLRSRAYALNLFVEAQRARQAPPSPRVVFHALLALAVLLNEDAFWPGIPHEEPRAGRLPSNVTAILQSIAMVLAALWDKELSRPDIPHDHTRSGLLSSDYAAVLGSIGGSLREYLQSTSRIDARKSMRLDFALKTPGDPQTRSGTITPQLAELDQLLQVLRVELKVPPPPAEPLHSRWISSNWCGLFFLSSTLERLGWVPAWGQLVDFQAGGAGCLVAGLALTIAGRFDPAVPSLDTAIALFAGYLHEPDLVHAARVFQKSSVEARLRMLRASLPHEKVDNMAETWEGTFERLAETLLRTFASRIRGFRQATQQGIVRSFIARPGRIRIDPERLVVFPVPSPFNVALHISGMDDPVDSSISLGGRRIEFELGEL
jgi:hypothetical protein